MESTTKATPTTNSKATVRARNLGATSRSVTTIASRLLLAIVIFQLPLFRVPCKAGVCTNPLEITALQLTSSKAAPLWVAKALIFPGACVHRLVTDLSLPSWDTVLDRYTGGDPDEKPPLLRLEVMAGSYFAVAGSLLGVFKPGRMSMFGMLLIAWGLVKEGLLNKDASAASDVHANPALVLAVVLGFLSIRFDFDKVQALTTPAAKPLRSSAKSKIK